MKRFLCLSMTIVLLCLAGCVSKQSNNFNSNDIKMLSEVICIGGYVSDKTVSKQEFKFCTDAVIVKLNREIEKNWKQVGASLTTEQKSGIKAPTFSIYVDDTRNDGTQLVQVRSLSTNDITGYILFSTDNGEISDYKLTVVTTVSEGNSVKKD